MIKFRYTLYRLVTLLQKLTLQVIPIPKVELLSGADSSLQLVKLAADKGYRRVLVVSDVGIKKLGLLDPIVWEFKQQGIVVDVYTEVLPDPDIEQIKCGLEASRQHAADIVFAVGGGSVIDTAKLVAALHHRRGSIAGKKGVMRILFKGLPLYVVPTTAGTGSEATMVSVISLKEQMKKVAYIDPVLMPKAAALDPLLCLGLPANITAATGMDVMTHAIEALLSNNATSTTDQQAIQAIRMVLSNLLRCHTDGNDLTARQDMLEASRLAGAAFNIAGVGYVHAIAHQLGARYGIPHGLANAMVLPIILAFYATKDSHIIRQAESKIYTGYTPSQSGRLLRDIQALCTSMAIPSFVECLARKDIPLIAIDAVNEVKFLYAVPIHMTTSDCEEVLHSLVFDQLHVQSN